MYTLSLLYLTLDIVHAVNAGVKLVAGVEVVADIGYNPRMESE
jgi:hypothetical protein